MRFTLLTACFLAMGSADAVIGHDSPLVRKIETSIWAFSEFRITQCLDINRHSMIDQSPLLYHAQLAAAVDESATPADAIADIPTRTVSGEAKDDETGQEKRIKDYDSDEDEYDAENKEYFEEELKEIDALIKLGMRIGRGEIEEEEAWKEIQTKYEEEEPEDFEELKLIVELGVKVAEGKFTEDVAWRWIFVEVLEDNGTIYESIGRQIREAVARGELTAIGSAEIWQALNREAEKIKRE